MQELQSTHAKGKDVFHEFTERQDGFLNARTVSDLSTWYKQLYDVRRSAQDSDELIELLDMCKSQQDGRNPFVRDIRVTPE